MAFKQLDNTSVDPARRVLISGAPNSRKTTSLHTWPHDSEHLLHILSYPGEKGYKTIDTKDPGVRAYVWEYGVEDMAKMKPHAVIKEIEQVTWEILGGKHGPCHVFAGDGLHKLYGWYYSRAYLDLLNSPGFQTSCHKQHVDPEETAKIQAYGSPHSPGAPSDFMLYLTKVSHSPVPFVVMTIWEEPERDDPADPRSKATHIFPALPGKLAQRITGEFDFVLYAEVGLAPGPNLPAPATWQTQPGGKVWGVGSKLPVELAKRLPAKGPQDFGKLLTLLEEKPKGEVKK